MAIKHEIRDNEIFVFGSNKAGKHGLGTALTARMKYGAEMGQGFGLQGQSLAIPVKDEQLKLLPLEEIKTYVDLFIDFAQTNFDKRFFVTPYLAKARRCQSSCLPFEYNLAISRVSFAGLVSR